MDRKIVAVIQARMGSTRLPGKVLMPILGRPVLWHIVNRLRGAEKIDQVVVATSDQEGDDPMESLCASEGIDCFRGSENDVLDRFYRAASRTGASTVIRITGDCPLVDPPLVGRLIDYFLDNGFDYCGVAAGAGVASEGFRGGRYPDGLDAEIFAMDVLATAWKEAEGQLFREHVTPFIWKQPDRFRLGTLVSEEKDYSELRWTLDNEEDYRLIAWIYEQLMPGNPHFGMHDILDLLERNPEKLLENKHFVGKEGYEEFWK